jgi:hypothetical protein
MVPHGLAILTLVAAATVSTHTTYPRNYVAAKLVKLNDNGVWSWFMDPRVNEGKLIIRSFRGVGSLEANIADPKSGNVEIAVYNIARETAQTVALHPQSRAGRPRRAGVRRTGGRPHTGGLQHARTRAEDVLPVLLEAQPEVGGAVRSPCEVLSE